MKSRHPAVCVHYGTARQVDQSRRGQHLRVGQTASQTGRDSTTTILTVTRDGDDAALWLERRRWRHPLSDRSPDVAWWGRSDSSGIGRRRVSKNVIARWLSGSMLPLSLAD